MVIPPTKLPPADTPGRDRAPTGDLTIRIVSGLSLIAVVLLVTILPVKGMLFHEPWPFLVMISIGIGLLSIEWGLMAAPIASARVAVAVAVAAIGGLFVGYLGHPILSILVLMFGSMCAGLYAHRLKSNWVDAAYGVLYIGWPAIVIMWLRQTSDSTDWVLFAAPSWLGGFTIRGEVGVIWVLFAFFIAWGADTAAYLVGRLVGGPKLWPRYSPNKTWSGFAGGLIAGMLVAGALSDLTHLFKHDTSASFVGLLVALATMAGDLWESALKRRFGVKDAGTLIPGHGGLMDRVDGLMFSIIAIGGIKLLVMLGTVI